MLSYFPLTQVSTVNSHHVTLYAHTHYTSTYIRCTVMESCRCVNKPLVHAMLWTR